MSGTITIQDRKAIESVTTRTWLVGIVVIAVGLRIVAALYMGNDIVSLPGVADQRSYHNLALRVVGGHGFSFGTIWWPITAADAPTAHWSYLYTLYLTAVYAIFGPNPLVARLIQAVAVGILQPVLLFQIGRIVFNRNVGLVAAFLGAVYIYFFYYAAALMTEAFYITAILGFLYLLICFAEPEIKHSWRWVLAMGVVLGAIVLLRQLFLFIVPFLFLWVWWARYRNGGKLPVMQSIVVGLIAILMVLPFTVYNYTRFERFVLLNTNAGYAFFWGNHPVHGTHFVPILTDVGVSYEALIPDELRSLDEAELESALMERGLQFIVDDPGRYVQLSLSRIAPYFEFWPKAETGLVGNVSRVMSFGVMLPFMIAGVIIALRQRTRRDMLSHPTALLFAFALIYAAIHILTWTLIRYRLPIDAVLLVFAALAIVNLAQWLAGKRHQSVTRA